MRLRILKWSPTFTKKATQMLVAGLTTTKPVFHFFGRTRTSLPALYYRTLDLGGNASNIVVYWSPLDEARYQHHSGSDQRGRSKSAEIWLLQRPSQIQVSLFLSFLGRKFLSQTLAQSGANSDHTFEPLGAKKISTTAPDRQWEIGLGLWNFEMERDLQSCFSVHDPRFAEKQDQRSAKHIRVQIFHFSEA